MKRSNLNYLAILMSTTLLGASQSYAVTLRGGAVHGKPLEAMRRSGFSSRQTALTETDIAKLRTLGKEISLGADVVDFSVSFNNFRMEQLSVLSQELARFNFAGTNGVVLESVGRKSNEEMDLSRLHWSVRNGIVETYTRQFLRDADDSPLKSQEREEVVSLMSKHIAEVISSNGGGSAQSISRLIGESYLKAKIEVGEASAEQTAEYRALQKSPEVRREFEELLRKAEAVSARYGDSDPLLDVRLKFEIVQRELEMSFTNSDRTKLQEILNELVGLNSSVNQGHGRIRFDVITERDLAANKRAVEILSALGVNSERAKTEVFHLIQSCTDVPHAVVALASTVQILNPARSPELGAKMNGLESALEAYRIVNEVHRQLATTGQ